MLSSRHVEIRSGVVGHQYSNYNLVFLLDCGELKYISFLKYVSVPEDQPSQHIRVTD